VKFEWDDNKQRINIKKHGISFEEAKTVFYDENALFITDPDHSILEERFLILGISKKTNLLTVCHCYKENEEIIRIINARKASSKEKKQYISKKGK